MCEGLKDVPALLSGGSDCTPLWVVPPARTEAHRQPAAVLRRGVGDRTAECTFLVLGVFVRHEPPRVDLRRQRPGRVAEPAAELKPRTGLRVTRVVAKTRFQPSASAPRRYPTSLRPSLRASSVSVRSAPAPPTKPAVWPASPCASTAHLNAPPARTARPARLGRPPPGARRDSSRAPAPVSPRARSNWPEQRERRRRFGVRLGLGVRRFHADVRRLPGRQLRGGWSVVLGQHAHARSCTIPVDPHHAERGLWVIIGIRRTRVHDHCVRLRTGRICWHRESAGTIASPDEDLVTRSDSPRPI